MTNSDNNYPPGVTAHDIPGWEPRGSSFYERGVLAMLSAQCAGLFCRKPHTKDNIYCEECREELDGEA